MMKAKLSEYVKVAEAAENFGSLAGNCENLGGGREATHAQESGYRLFLRRDLEAFFEQCAKPYITKPRQASAIDTGEVRSDGPEGIACWFIDADAWSTLHSDTCRPFEKPRSGRIEVKVINHLGDEVMNVLRV